MNEAIWSLLVASFLAVAAPAHAQDPSTIPGVDGVGDKEPGAFAERFRITADLDGDGRDDLILSEDIRTFGTGGGTWTVYLSRPAGFDEVGTITAHPGAVSIEPDHDAIQRQEKDRIYVRIWTYWKSSGREGSLYYYRVGPSGVFDGGRLTIYPGDGGSELGRGVYEAVFKHSEIPLRVEKSSTDAKGTVTWRPYYGSPRS